jgi:hypothetical protein
VHEGAVESAGSVERGEKKMVLIRLRRCSIFISIFISSYLSLSVHGSCALFSRTPAVVNACIRWQPTGLQGRRLSLPVGVRYASSEHIRHCMLWGNDQAATVCSDWRMYDSRLLKVLERRRISEMLRPRVLRTG